MVDMSVKLENILPSDRSRYEAICEVLGVSLEVFLIRAITKYAEEWEVSQLYCRIQSKTNNDHTASL